MPRTARSSLATSLDDLAGEDAHDLAGGFEHASELVL